ncbi:MAG: hypothetical protein ACFCUI_12300 [Bernardetiaceae bacterium]
MNLYKKFFLLALSSVLLFGLSSCGKDDDNGKSEPTLEESVQGRWTCSALTRDGVDAGINLSGFSLTLNANGAYSATFGAVPAFATGTGNWSITSTTLTLSGNSFNFTGTPTSSQMVFSFTDPNDKTNPTYVITLSK